MGLVWVGAAPEAGDWGGDDQRFVPRSSLLMSGSHAAPRGLCAMGIAWMASRTVTPDIPARTVKPVSCGAAAIARLDDRLWCALFMHCTQYSACRPLCSAMHFSLYRHCSTFERFVSTYEELELNKLGGLARGAGEGGECK